MSVQHTSMFVPDRSLFRAYDIRGVVDETLTTESIYLIGKALASLALDCGEKALLVARDGRESGPRLLQALMEGIQSTGCEMIDIGMVPTPVLYFATHVLPYHSGVMLTGSHNPSHYNGLKMIVRGVTLSQAEIEGLYQRILVGKWHSGHGQKSEYQIKELYLQRVTALVHLERPLHVVVDAGNGVTGELAPQLLRALGCRVDELYCEVDGSFPNHHPDPSLAENLQDLSRIVQEKTADLGIAFDGDGDRLGVVTNKGRVIAADQLMMLFSKALLAEQPGARIIFDVKCTDHLAKMIRKWNGEPIMWKTGHSFIKAKLAETGALLAGEMSGHIFFKHRWYGFDDALYAAARLLQLVGREHTDVETMCEFIPKTVITPELKIAVSEEEKFILMQKLLAEANFADALEMNQLDGLRVSFREGWGLVRPSNTSPYLILRFEAETKQALKKIQTTFRAWILSACPNLVLPF